MEWWSHIFGSSSGGEGSVMDIYIGYFITYKLYVLNTEDKDIKTCVWQCIEEAITEKQKQINHKTNEIPNKSYYRTVSSTEWLESLLESG